MSAAWAICKDARRTAHLTQRELAERAGVAGSTIARIERGRMEPTLDLLQRLVRACGLDLRMRVTADDGSESTARHAAQSLSFETRLLELKRVSEFAIAAQQSLARRAK